MPIGEDLRENPFFVLGLGPEASSGDIERTGQRLLGELGLGREGARTYRTPLGVEERTPERVRTALAELRDPARRLLHEVWAHVAPEDVGPAVGGVTWPWAERRLGVRRR